MVHPLFYVREQAEEERKIKVTKSGWAGAGKGFMPFLKQCSTYFSKRLGHFLRKGIKPFPAPDCSTYFSKRLGHFLRVGINPTPTEAECYNHLDNPLIAKVLHKSAVGTGFIPVLPTANKIQSKCQALPASDKIQSKCHAAARVGITPAAAECCNILIISRYTKLPSHTHTEFDYTDNPL